MKDYGKLLEKATLAYRNCTSNAEKRRLESIFPELKVANDGNIRKEIIAYLDVQNAISGGDDRDFKDWIAWLEKQGESSKPRIGSQTHEGDPGNPYDMSFEDAQQYASERGIDIPINDGDVFVDGRHITQTVGNILRWADEHQKGEPKFRVGDWIISDDSSINKDYDICRIINVEDGNYTVESIYGYKGRNTFEMFEKNYRLWSIAYAKNGDILSYVTDKGDLWIMSYYSLYEPYRWHVHYNALLANDELSGKGTCYICIDNLKPATKEQREQLEKALEGAISDN